MELRINRVRINRSLPVVDFLHVDFDYFDNLSTETLSGTWVIVSDHQADLTPNDKNICNVIIVGQTDVVTVTCEDGDLKPPQHARHTCYTIGNAPYDIVTVTCNYRGNPPIRGRYVTLR